MPDDFDPASDWWYWDDDEREPDDHQYDCTCEMCLQNHPERDILYGDGKYYGYGDEKRETMKDPIQLTEEEAKELLEIMAQLAGSRETFESMARIYQQHVAALKEREFAWWRDAYKRYNLDPAKKYVVSDRTLQLCESATEER